MRHFDHNLKRGDVTYDLIVVLSLALGPIIVVLSSLFALDPFAIFAVLIFYFAVSIVGACLAVLRLLKPRKTINWLPILVLLVVDIGCLLSILSLFLNGAINRNT